MATSSTLDRAEVRSGTGEVLPDTGGSEHLKDVWSRSGSKYRVRAVALLVLNAMLFAGVGSFAYWLRTGEVFAPATPGYWRGLAATFQFGSESNVSLGSLLIQPISVQQTEMQIWVLGLLMAALIAVPILIAILYRFWSSVPFIAVVGFLAVMPWLAITLLASCVIASVRPFRSRFRFMSALFALVPAVIYLVLAWSGTGEVLVGVVDPVDRIKFMAPWVLAIVAATAAFAIVLTLARLVDYRPGAVAPLVAVMFAMPVGLFEFHVGRDELYFRLLESFSRAHFRDMDARLTLDRRVEEEWTRYPYPRPARDAVRERTEMAWLFGLSDVSPQRSAVTAYQLELIGRCNDFLRRYPDSRHAYEALYIRARTWDTRVDAAEFRRTQWIRFYDDFPAPASYESWRLVSENRRGTSLGALAALRLAQLDSREGKIELAIDRLEELQGTLEELRQRAVTSSTAQMASTAGSAFAGLNVAAPVDLDEIGLQSARLLDLLRENRDPIYGYDPLCGAPTAARGLWYGLLDCEPRHDAYRDNLHRLKKAYYRCTLEDNLDLEIAKCAANGREKIGLLEDCIRRHPQGDALPEALFRLAVAHRDAGFTAESERSISRLVVDFGDSIWADEAMRLSPRPVGPRLTRMQGGS